ncbi:MAG: hypothetical protein H0U73_02015 [Tatlockia sp.]|nr:hypothetical protein [Tatlockia sp.]
MENLIDIFFGIYSDGKEGGKDSYKDGHELGMSMINGVNNQNMDYRF